MADDSQETTIEASVEQSHWAIGSDHLQPARHGVEPRAAVRWKDAVVSVYVQCEDASIKDTEQALQEVRVAQLWGESASLRLGNGLQSMLAFDVVLSHIAKTRQRDDKLANVAVRLLSGGWWTEALKAEAGLGEAGCTFCGRPGTEAHHVCSCSALDQPDLLADQRIAQPQHLWPLAVEAGFAPEAKWSRFWLLEPELELEPPRRLRREAHRCALLAQVRVEVRSC